MSLAVGMGAPSYADTGSEPAPERASGDKHYPELAKTLFKKGEGEYRITEPKSGGKSAGKVPAGLEAYYSQKIDWSAENCADLGAEDASKRIGRSAECGYMIAPIDTKNPDKGNIAIAVQRVKAGKVTFGKDDKGQTVATGFKPNPNPKGSVLHNPGGPGQLGLELAAKQAEEQPKLAEDFDMIGFDPRGVGVSMPFSECATDKEQDASRQLNPWTDGQRRADEIFYSDTKKQTEACFKNTGKLFGLDAEGRKNLIKHLGTWDAVDDMDILRSVVGDEKLHYVGWSYGTAMGYRYAQKHGDSVGRLVLDGAVDIGDTSAGKQMAGKSASRGGNHTSVASANNSTRAGGTADVEGLTHDQKYEVKRAAGFQDTFEQFARDCVTKGRQGKTYGELWPDVFGGSEIADEAFSCALGDNYDARQLSENNAKLLQTLETAGGGKGLPTGSAEDKRRVTFGAGRLGVYQALYSTGLWPQLNHGLNELKEGESAGELMSLADMYEGRDDSGRYDASSAAFDNIRCTNSNSADEVKGEAKREQVRKFSEAYDEAAPFQRATVSAGRYDPCDFWQFTSMLPNSEKLSDVPNILVVSTSHDPSTPYAAGVKMAEAIEGSLLSVSGSEHSAYLGRDTCVDKTVNDYLASGNLPRSGSFGKKLDRPDRATDHRGKTTALPNQCNMKSFHSGVRLSDSEAQVGDSVGYTSSQLDPESDYSLQVGEEEKAFTTDKDGNYSGEFTVPNGLKAEETADVKVTDSKGKTVNTLGLKILGEDKPKDEASTSDASTDEATSSASADGAADDGEAKDNDPKDDDAESPISADGGQDGNGLLPRTGAELAGILVIAVVLLGAGAWAVVRSRRRLG
ncbi:alpha/beta hydrolase [Brevibacterium sp. Marseille-P9724]|uniref:alpha/beta hydrolase n=1 Tax=Brevibacterium sp. Marseille-P9724 TaxID=2614125 RepID=UPI001865C19E|nr:alpha/beta hydrolase [Brevibacterium sp. Marseille-P9724]